MSYAYGTHQRQEERAKADRAWGAGARPRGSWTKSEIVRMIDKKLGFVEAAIADGYPHWFLLEHFLRIYSVERTGRYGRYTQYYVIDEAAVKALADNPWEYDELLSKERRLRKVQGEMKKRFPQEWPRRYGLYRKYCGCGVGHDVFLDADTSLAALQRECEARAGKRRSDKGDAEGQL